VTVLKDNFHTYLGNSYEVAALPHYGKGIMIRSFALLHISYFTGHKLASCCEGHTWASHVLIMERLGVGTL
jgi:hypothetical protein